MYLVHRRGLENPELDNAVRLASFKWLAGKVESLGDVLPRALLHQGFEFHESRIPLVSPQGIFKPRMMEVPLSITSTTSGVYHDALGRDGLLTYRYRGSNPNHPDNVGLRRASELQLPLVYLLGIVPGKYLAVWPVYVVKDDPAGLSFTVAVDDIAQLPAAIHEPGIGLDTEGIRRAYITGKVKIRLHQSAFRERVLAAYRSQCALCKLKHAELLDAAHIIPDNEPEGEPSVNNGIALCKLHHSAFDAYIIGISPDFKIHVRTDILHEHDGPILQVGLQQMQGRTLILPSSQHSWPSRDALEKRYHIFKKTA